VAKQRKADREANMQCKEFQQEHRKMLPSQTIEATMFEKQT
jgi:hypothetical protein